MNKLTKISFILSMVFMLGACSSNGTGSDKSIDFEKTMDVIIEKADKNEIMIGATGDNPDEATLTALYGIDSSMVDDYYLAIPMVNIQANEIAMFKVKEGKMEDVKAGVAKRLASLEDNWKQYLPDQYELVKNYTEHTEGDYYFMIISEDADKILDVIKAEFK